MPSSQALVVDTAAFSRAAFSRAVFGGRPFVGTAAVAAGILTPHDLQVRFTRLLPGVHLARGATLDAHGRVRAAMLWAPPGAVIAGHAAALLYDEPWFAEDAVRHTIDVYLPRFARAPRGIRVRQVRHPFGAADLAVEHGITCTSVARTALDLARWERDPVEAVAMVDSLCNTTGTRLPAVSAHARGLAGMHGRRRALEIFDRCDHRADSPPESRLRLEYEDSALPNPQLQLEIADSRGRRIATADFGYERERVAIFYDGGGHLAREQRDWDSDVTAQLSEEGWRSLRVTAGMVRRRGVVLRRTADLLRRQGFPVDGY